MPLQQILEEVTSPDVPIVPSRLAELSNLEDGDLEAFKADWPLVTRERRHKVIVTLAQLAEDNVDLDFSAVFRHALDDEEDTVRAGAIAGLWEVEERALIRPFIRLLLQDSSELVRASAAQALGRFTLLAETGKLLERDRQRLAEALLEIIDSEFEAMEVRRRAVEAIAPLSLERVPDIIQQAYEDEEEFMRASALFAMGRTCDPHWLPTLLEEIENKDAEFRYEAASALAELGEEEAIVHLIPLISDADAQVQAAAIEAVGAIGGGVAKRVLQQADQNSDPRIAELAQAALRLMDFQDDPLADRDGP